MPELPDVEVMRRVIAPGVRGRTFSRVTLNWNNAVKAPSPGEFREGLMGATIEDVGRRAKYFLFQLKGLAYAHCSLEDDGFAEGG